MMGKPSKFFTRLLNLLHRALLADGKKHDIKSKPKRRPKGQARHTPRKKAGTSNVDIWRTVSPSVRKAARERAAALVGKGTFREGEPDRRDDGPNPYAQWEITESTRSSLRNLVTKAIDNGWTVSQLQHEIIVSERFSADRALTIAWTEKALAHSHGTHESAKDTGMKFKKWLLGNGDCKVCQANANQGCIPINDPFQSGVNYPPAHTRCRCAAGYYESKDEVI
jgi:hypothetical protein